MSPFYTSKSKSNDVCFLRYGVGQTNFLKILRKWKKPGDIILFFTHVYNKWRSYDVWFSRYKVWMTEFFLILDHFLPFYPIGNTKNQNFEKMKKTPGDIIISHKCTINNNHMMYDSWDLKHTRKFFLSIWAIFCPFTPLTTQKIKILKKWKKHMEISSFYICVTNIEVTYRGGCPT